MHKSNPSGLSARKIERLDAIRELVSSRQVTSQQELRRRLVKRGFDVTQATLSRDIRELKLVKGADGYAFSAGANGSENGSEDALPGIDQMLASFGLKVKQALNQLVVITASGAAQPVALAIDGESWPEVVGTIAGDDTVLVICPDQKQASMLGQRIDALIG